MTRFSTIALGAGLSVLVAAPNAFAAQPTPSFRVYKSTRRPPVAKPAPKPCPKPRATGKSNFISPIPGIRASKGSVGNATAPRILPNGRLLVNGRQFSRYTYTWKETQDPNVEPDAESKAEAGLTQPPAPPDPPPPTPTDLIAAPWRPTADEFGPRASRLGALSPEAFNLAAGRRGAVPLWLSGSGPRVWEDTATTAYGDPYTVHFAVVSVPLETEESLPAEEAPAEDGLLHGPPSRLAEKPPLHKAFLRARAVLGETIAPTQVTLLDFYVDEEASTVHVIAGGKSIAQVVAP